MAYLDGPEGKGNMKATQQNTWEGVPHDHVYENEKGKIEIHRGDARHDGGRGWTASVSKRRTEKDFDHQMAIFGNDDLPLVKKAAEAALALL